MKAKTIKSVLRRVHANWINTIEDGEVKKLASENTIVTGGSIASMLLAEKVNDYDLYFRTKEATKAITEYYVEKFKKNPPSKFKDQDKTIPIEVREEGDRIKIVIKSAGIASEEGTGDYKYFEMDPNPESTDAQDYVEEAIQVVEDSKDSDDKEKHRPVFLTANAITLSGKIQIVVRFWGEPDKIHENYDFVHCMNYWQSWDGKLELRPEALEALLTRELRYVGSKYPFCSFVRTRKFIRKGWTINAGQYLKMAMQLSDLDMNDVNVLEDQLTGVDAAYFYEVIQAIKEKDDKKVDRAYLLQVIDRIF